MKISLTFIGIVLFLLIFNFVFSNLMISIASPKSFYVSPQGNDANPGTEEKPWKTIQHAANTLQPGQTVYIRQGIYHESVITTQSGNESQGPITFANYPGEKPIIDGDGVKDANTGFIINQSFININGLQIKNWNDHGIWIENAGFVEISNCVISHVTAGIGFVDGTHHFVLNGVEAYDFIIYGFDASPGGENDCHHGIFNNCLAHSGQDPDQNVDGFALGHGTQHDFELNHCLVYEVYDGFDISAHNTTLNGCEAYHCWNSGFKIWQDQVKLVNCLSYRNQSANVELDWNGKPKTVTLQNCTLVGADTFNIWINNGSDSLHMYNTILADGKNIGLAFEDKNATNYQGDYNIFHNSNPDRVIAVGYEDEFSIDQMRSGAWTSYSGQDQHSLVIESLSQLFIDASKNDFHLHSHSAAIDQGAEQKAPLIDFDGNSRPQGKGIDIGAYEYY